MIRYLKKDRKKMPGTEGTGKYVVVATSPLGRVGIRKLEGVFDGLSRIRLEARHDKAEKAMQKGGEFADWKQPDSQPRFSTVVEDGEDRNAAIAKAINTLGPKIVLEDEAPDWVRELIDQAA